MDAIADIPELQERQRSFNDSQLERYPSTSEFQRESNVSNKSVRQQYDPHKLTNDTRQLGLIVARGTAITVVAPNDGIEQIANPFIQAD
uniref:Uncharacterized protein n=1 Tax=Plectus sambesii TaxID=2011161 RepID=A0A914UNA7_9BILA